MQILCGVFFDVQARDTNAFFFALQFDFDPAAGG